MTCKLGARSRTQRVHFRPARGSGNFCHKMIPLRAPPEISLHEDTSAHEPASILTGSTNSEAPLTSLASYMDLSENHFSLDRARNVLLFGAMPLLTQERKLVWSRTISHFSREADPHLATLRFGNHDTRSKVEDVGLYGPLPRTGWCHQLLIPNVIQICTTV